MDKILIINAIIDKLRGELQVYLKAANASRAEATHESSKAENKYDTRGLEASYLARGQSRLIVELEVAISEFSKLAARKFEDSDPIDVGALVELERERERTLCFIGPRAGGTEVEYASRVILVITPQSPLGSQLVGRLSGEALKIILPGAHDEYRIVKVS